VYLLTYLLTLNQFQPYFTLKRFQRRTEWATAVFCRKPNQNWPTTVWAKPLQHKTLPNKPTANVWQKLRAYQLGTYWTALRSRGDHLQHGFWNNSCLNQRVHYMQWETFNGVDSNTRNLWTLLLHTQKTFFDHGSLSQNVIKWNNELVNAFRKADTLRRKLCNIYNKHLMGCEVNKSDLICGIPSGFISTSVHARLQVFACSSYDLFHPGYIQTHNTYHTDSILTCLYEKLSHLS